MNEPAPNSPWHADILTLFPQMFPGPLASSLAARGLENGLWSYGAHNIRDHAMDRHHTVDGPPAGGGPGMVLRADVLARAIDAVKPPHDTRPLVCLSARGVRLTQKRVRELAAGPGVVLLCGRFEGIDDRVLQARNAEEVSVGDIIMSGGEIAATALMDAAIRLLPGIMGDAESGDDESFERGLLEYPQYTKPREFEGREIPAVLLSGDHGKVAEWRRDKAKETTRVRRADLWQDFLANETKSN